MSFRAPAIFLSNAASSPPGWSLRALASRTAAVVTRSLCLCAKFALITLSTSKRQHCDGKLPTFAGKQAALKLTMLKQVLQRSAWPHCKTKIRPQQTNPANLTAGTPACKSSRPLAEAWQRSKTRCNKDPCPKPCAVSSAGDHLDL